MPPARPLRDAERDEHASWYKATTGPSPRSKYWNVHRDQRGYPFFVKASAEQLEGQQQSDIGNGTSIVLDAESEETDGESASAQESAIEPARSNHLHSQETMADLYARLIRESDEKTKDARKQSREPLDAFQKPNAKENPRANAKRSSHNTSGNSEDWFIDRALKGKADADVQLTACTLSPAVVVSADVPAQCRVCKAVLSPPVTVGALEAHQGSIGHQIAADSDVVVPRQTPASSCIPSNSCTAARRELTVLESFNVGYIALERMGWRSGMGLGREEWNNAHQSQQFQSRQSSLRHSSLGDGNRSKTGHAQDAAAHQEPGKLADEALLRPTLVPIPLLKRPDRRGIGIALPASARVRDRPSKFRSPNVQECRDHLQAKKPTKAQARDRRKKEHEEFKALRQSLE